MATTYEHILKDGFKVQVDSAIRDGNGAKIDTTYEKVSNKVTSMSSSSTDTQYPSAKAVYNALNNKLPKTWIIGSNASSNANGWYKFLSVTMPAIWSDTTFLFTITENFGSTLSGSSIQFVIYLRRNDYSTADAGASYIKPLANSGLSANSIIGVFNGNVTDFYYYINNNAFSSATVTLLSVGNGHDGGQTYTTVESTSSSSGLSASIRGKNSQAYYQYINGVINSTFAYNTVFITAQFSNDVHNSIDDSSGIIIWISQDGSNWSVASRFSSINAYPKFQSCSAICPAGWYYRVTNWGDTGTNSTFCTVTYWGGN